jgi:hypothetical protein
MKSFVIYFAHVRADSKSIKKKSNEVSKQKIMIKSIVMKKVTFDTLAEKN